MSLTPLNARRRARLARGGCVIIAALLALGLWVPAAVASPSVQSQSTKLLLAFYYTWFSPADFDGARTPDVPLVAYDSTSKETVERQVREARDAGIDAFITSWSGLDTPSDHAFAQALDVAAANSFRITPYVETGFVSQRGEVGTQLQGFISRYANHPAFLKWGGKPVLFFWSPQTVGGAAQWKALRSRIDPSGGQVWSVDATDQSYLDAFDTLHFFSGGKWQANTDLSKVNAQWKGIVDAYNKRHGTRKLWVAGVIPGWDESRVQPPRPNAKVFPRRDGALYQEAWKAATASSPDWITITSFNEWYEGTQIEPARSYGNRYLDLTRQYATAWKGPAGQPNPALNAPQPSNPCAGGILFPETGRTLCRSFEGYWRGNGALQQFGYPISEPFSEKSALDGKAYTVQYFERAVFELHPENKPPYDVLLSQLGTFYYRKSYPNGAPNQRQNREAGRLFPETGKWVGGAFLQRWLGNGGLAVNGYPISDEFEEKLADGKVYTVQYFERARFEFHPENQQPYLVLLGALGRLAWDSRGR